MSTSSYAIRDSLTMLRRSIKRMIRYPVIFYLVGIPVVFLLMFVYVFGGALGAGIGGPSGGRAEYANYVMPGILLITVGGLANGPAISVNTDMTEGIIARFRTMNIYRSSVLNGHALGYMIQAVLALAIVTGVGLLVGFRPSANGLEWLGATGILLLASWAAIWFGVVCGLVTKSLETASNLPLPVTLLPLFGSGFVPTDSMPKWLAVFAEYQPFTPMIETVRALMFGTAIGNNGILAVGWGVVITVACYLWSKSLYNREPTP